MLNHIQGLESFSMGSMSTPEDMGLYVFPNCTNGALIGVKYPLKAGSQVSLLLRLAFEERLTYRPTIELLAPDAAAKLGISLSTLRRWIAKGWIYYWPAEDADGREVKVFSEAEVEALRLAKPRDL